MWSKGKLVFGLCGKDKSDTLFSLINLTYVHGTKEKIYMFIYTHLRIIES